MDDKRQIYKLLLFMTHEKSEAAKKLRRDARVTASPLTTPVWETEADGGIGGGAWAMARSADVMENRRMVFFYYYWSVSGTKV